MPMRSARSRVALGVACASTLLFTADRARANGLEIPSNGTEQMARGAAWLARATDPLATFYNPAALSRNGNGVSLTANLFFQKNCFTRVGLDGNPNDLTVGQKGNLQTYGGPVCNDVKPFPNPQLAFQYRITDKLGLGVAVMGPSANGKLNYPETTTNTGAFKNVKTSTIGVPIPDQPSATRYMLTSLDALVIWPQIGIGYEVAPNFRIGASLIWGIANLKFGNYSIGVTTDQTYTNGKLNETASSDLKASVEAHNYFVPGFVLSAMYTIADEIDLSAWYHYSADIHATGSVDVEGFMFDSSAGSTIKPPNQTPTMPGQSSTAHISGVDVTAPQPMEARIGARYHLPREGVTLTEKGGLLKDPLRDEVFDVELDLEWSNDSHFKTLEIRLPAATVFPPGAPAAIAVPQNADTVHNWKDAYGFRLGSDVNVIPDALAVRGGVWFQSSSIDPRYLDIDFIPAQRFAVTAGGTYRLKPVDIQIGYAHVFYRPVNNEGQGSLLALAGGPLPNRSTYPVNGGRLTASTNIASLGVVWRF